MPKKEAVPALHSQVECLVYWQIKGNLANQDLLLQVIELIVTTESD